MQQEDRTQKPLAPDRGDAHSGDNRVGQEPLPKKGRKKWPIVVGVCAAVVLLAGVGFWTWHEQPSFCNAICHEPMDPYVDGYYQDSSTMAYAHQVADTACLDCHVPTIDEQVGEALAWAAGDYETDAAGMLVRVNVRSDAKMCATANCHNFEEVTAATADWGGEAGVNPHESHQGYAIDCSNCHTAHGQSVMYCNACHDYEVPEGWAEPVKSADRVR